MLGSKGRPCPPGTLRQLTRQMSDSEEYANNVSAAEESSGEDSHASEISAMYQSQDEASGAEEGAAKDVQDATPGAGRRRSARLRTQPQKTRSRLLVIDDDDGTFSEEDLLSDLDLEPAHVSGRRRRKRSRAPARRTKRVRNTLPLQLVPEDVPWKEPNPQPAEDPNRIEFWPEVAFIVIFMNTFSALFEDLQPMGPQDIEQGIMSGDDAVQKLFVKLLALVLNRKKEIEPDRYTSALGELHALLPVLGVGEGMPDLKWKSKTAFLDLTWEERLTFLNTLVQWSIVSSQKVTKALDRLTEDAIMPWIGSDNENQKYYFVQGLGDTPFRVYRETNRLLTTVSWKPVASTLQELELLVKELAEQGKSSAKLAAELEELVPELRESEERRLKEQRRMRRRNDLAMQADMVRLGEGRYSGRTRGNRVDYSMLAYDRELDRAISHRRSARVLSRESESPGPDAMHSRVTRQSRRVRGEAPVTEYAPSYLEVEAAQAAEPVPSEEPKNSVEATNDLVATPAGDAPHSSGEVKHDLEPQHQTQAEPAAPATERTPKRDSQDPAILEQKTQSPLAAHAGHASNKGAEPSVEHQPLASRPQPSLANYTPPSMSDASPPVPSPQRAVHEQGTLDQNGRFGAQFGAPTRPQKAPFFGLHPAGPPVMYPPNGIPLMHPMQAVPNLIGHPSQPHNGPPGGQAFTGSVNHSQLFAPHQAMAQPRSIPSMYQPHQPSDGVPMPGFSANVQHSGQAPETPGNQTTKSPANQGGATRME